MKNQTTTSSGPKQEAIVELCNFTDHDCLTLKTNDRFEAAFELGKKTAASVKQTLKEKLSAHEKTGNVEKTQSLFTKTQELVTQKTFFIDGVDYLDRYLNILESWCKGAGISLLHGAFLQSYADVGCQTILVRDTKNNSINVIHMEENPDDDQLMELNKTLDASRQTQTHEALFATNEELIKHLYRYKVVTVETENRSQLFFAYPGLCTGGAAFGVDITHKTLFVADTLTPTDANGPYHTWANTIVSMMFDGGTIDVMRKIIATCKNHAIKTLGGYAIHAATWEGKSEIVSYEFANHIIEEQSPIQKDSRLIIGQTNWPMAHSLQTIDLYKSPKENLDDIQLSHLIKRRTAQLCDTAIGEIFPTGDNEKDAKRLLEIIASPIGDVETFDHGPVFSGFSTLPNAAYVVGSFSHSGGKIVVGKLTPPTVPGHEYSLMFDPSNPIHMKNRLADLKHLAEEFNIKTQTPMHVAILYSTPTKRLLGTPYASTDEDTSYVASKIAEALKSKNIHTSLVELHEDDIEKIDTIKADCIFNLIEWTGLDTTFASQAFAHLRIRNIPVTGATEANYMETANKITMKQALMKADIPTPSFQVFVSGRETPDKNLSYPLIVKPAYEHCSIGLTANSIAHDPQELARIVKSQIQTFDQPALAEEFVQGREVLAYLLEEGETIRILPIEEILFTSGKPLAFQTYESKWDKTHTDYQTTQVAMAKLSEKEQAAIEAVCRSAFKKLQFRGYARFDLRLKEGIPYILETNCNPNIYDSDEDQIPGIPFPDFVEAIITSAFYHFNRGWKI